MPVEIKPQISHAPVWVNCPASERGRAVHPEPDFPNPAREEGIACAWVAEGVLKGQKHGSEFLGRLGPNAVLITDEMLEEVIEPYIRRVKELFIPGCTINNNPPHVEHKGTVFALPWHPEARKDLWWLDIRAGICYVLDLKAGRIREDSVGNWQLAGYFVELEPIVVDACARHGVEFQGFHGELVQPRKENGPPWFLRPNELAPLKERMKQRGVEAMGPNPEQTTGPWCRKCPKRHTCTSYRKSSDTILDYVDTYLDDDLGPEALEAEMALLQEGLERIKHRLSGVEAHVKQNAREGKSAVYDIQPTYGRQNWTVGADIAIATAATFGVDISKGVAAKTPKQAIKAGVPQNVIDAISKSEKTGLGLVKRDPENDRELSKKLFGESNNV